MLLKLKNGRYKIISLEHNLLELEERETGRTHKLSLGLYKLLLEAEDKMPMEDLDIFVKILEGLTHLEARYIQMGNSSEALYFNGLRLSILKKAMSDFKLEELSPLLTEIQRDFSFCNLAKGGKGGKDATKSS